MNDATFYEGDVVVAKDEFLNEGETLKDTVGLVLSHNPENDYMVLGVLDPEKYAIPPTFSVRGEYYRKITGKEIEEWGIVLPEKEPER